MGFRAGLWGLGSWSARGTVRAQVERGLPSLSSGKDSALPMQGLWLQSLVWELRLISLIFLIFINLIGIKCNLFCFAFSWLLVRLTIFYFINYPFSLLFNKYLFLYFGYFSLVVFCQPVRVHCAEILIYHTLIFTIYLILIISWGKTPWWSCG